MIKIKIKVDLERRLRAQISESPLIQEVVALIDAEKERAGGVEAKKGIGYQEILGLFRAELGANLAVPPSPSPGWIIRQVTRAREIGLDEQQVRAIVKGAREQFPRSPWELEWLLRAATRLQAERIEEQSTDISTVYSGRE